jgi:branched-chain amino acid transport system permease protein
LLLTLGVICLLFLPLGTSAFYVQLCSKIMIMAVFAMSLDLLVGYTGLVSLGHAAFFGAAAYAIALISPKYQAANLWLTLPLVMLISAALALVIGLLVLRTSGFYFIMVTLAFAQMLYYLCHDTKLGGGSDGLYLYVKPDLSVAGFSPIKLENPLHFYYFVFLLMIIVYFFLRMVLASSFGRVLAGLKSNEQRTRSLGFSVFRYKLAAFVLAGALAGLAGYLAACQFGFVSPEILSWHYSANVLMMVILGGMGRLYGALIGAFAFVFLQEFFANQAIFGPLAKHWQLAVGAFIVLAVLWLPSGLAGLLGTFDKRSSDAAA